MFASPNRYYVTLTNKGSSKRISIRGFSARAAMNYAQGKLGGQWVAQHAEMVA